MLETAKQEIADFIGIDIRSAPLWGGRPGVSGGG